MSYGRYAFDKTRRVRTARQYRAVFTRPERRRDRLFTVLIRANQIGFARLGMAISKRSLPKAVDRNRVKRVIRETFRLSCSRLAAVDIVVLGQSPLRSAENEAMRDALKRLWRLND